jgi:NADH:ubiquinone oxidoreductase subunit 4 (subunit M)
LIIAGVYMLRAIRSIWHGDKQWPALSDVTNPWRRLPYVLLLAGLIIFGCFPRLLTDDIKTSVTPVARQMGQDIAVNTSVVGGRP